MAQSEASQQANRSGLTALRLVVLFYLLGGIVLVIFLSHVLASVFAGIGWSDRELIEGVQVATAPGMAALVLSAAIAAGTYWHVPTRTLLLECATEMMKVTWPTWAETRASTLAVVFASLVAAFVLFGIDTISYKLMVVWLPAVWGKL